MKNIASISTLAGSLLLLATSQANATIIGPDPYFSFADSPFSTLTFSSFSLEDFQSSPVEVGVDGIFDLAFGATIQGGGLVITSDGFGGSIIDSVDGDDGVIDGLGNSNSGDGSAESIWAASGVLVSFAPGMFPTHAGMVWTDGGNHTFEAFDELGFSLGSITGTHAGAGFGGQTDEDRFYGAINLSGISSMRFSGGAIEVDHIQFGIQGNTPPMSSVPESSTLGIMGLGLIGLGLSRRKRAKH